ncbi:hypothetical protein KBB05_05575 [Patescibacteria group bacterium]|nr:hypothetical protein [Patescibacteria group bacterium]
MQNNDGCNRNSYDKDKIEQQPQSENKANNNQFCCCVPVFYTQGYRLFDSIEDRYFFYNNNNFGVLRKKGNPKYDDQSYYHQRHHQTIVDLVDVDFAQNIQKHNDTKHKDHSLKFCYMMEVGKSCTERLTYLVVVVKIVNDSILSYRPKNKISKKEKDSERDHRPSDIFKGKKIENVTNNLITCIEIKLILRIKIGVVDQYKYKDKTICKERKQYEFSKFTIIDKLKIGVDKYLFDHTLTVIFLYRLSTKKTKKTSLSWHLNQ